MDTFEESSHLGPWTIFILTCRRPEIDFRLPIARALAALGHDVHYVFLKRQPTHTRFVGAVAETKPISLLNLITMMRRSLKAAPQALVLNSTNLAFPGFCTTLRYIVGGLWCLDLHDDLLYEVKGFRRRLAKTAQSLLVKNSDFMVHAAPTLVELFPQSVHLGNASAMTPLVREGFQTDRVLVLASLDGRFDFGFLSSVAGMCGQTLFEIYGQVSVPSVASNLNALVATSRNIIYRGPYDNLSLPTLLSQYSVTLAPYVRSSILTKYIDPLRYYHCLNSGMEVISTDIPSARAIEKFLHVIERPEEVETLLRRLSREPELRRNNRATHELFNWNMKAKRLMEIASERLQSLHTRLYA